jgi:hypothetical protein
MGLGGIAMKSFVLLRIAAIVAFLYALGHTLGMPWVPDEGPETMAIVQSMAAHRFDAMGAQRSMRDFYFGFGISISVFMLAQAILLWLIAGQARLDPERMRPFIAVLLLAFIANAIIAAMYFFAVPCVMASIIAICLLIAWIAAKPVAT